MSESGVPVFFECQILHFMHFGEFLPPIYSGNVFVYVTENIEIQVPVGKMCYLTFLGAGDKMCQSKKCWRHVPSIHSELDITWTLLCMFHGVSNVHKTGRIQRSEGEEEQLTKIQRSQ